MKNIQSTLNEVKIIENLLEEVLCDLESLTEENFDSVLKSAKAKMSEVEQKRLENKVKSNDFKQSEKIVQLAKLIPEKFDNVIKDWADKLKVVQKEMEFIQNQKKITIYNR
ncbi:MAG: hypothetical protein PHY57_02775 [Ignavibacterium sp.]|jgi:FMN-dependent NADH-azoreductase|nr:hypothetical protein [Ignavibacterium sp.]MDX9711460.1 hypothetical protein [Ignavibacteriaceae bacterium]MEB2355058.1 hypothetical protein [Ignavibacteriales bacterium]GIK22550.1 MAG: hypothetical protein BroJett005_19640 [Ignavibacteriota bacterium]